MEKRTRATLRKIIVATTAFAVLLALSIFDSSPALAVNACSQTQNYDSISCDFDTEQGRSFGTEMLATCDDGFGFMGADYLQRISFDSVRGDGQISKGTELPFRTSVIQECNPYETAYQFSVSVVSPTGVVYASENMKSAFTYKDRFSSPTLSYCSTKTCGWATLSGVIKLPPTASDGQYSVKIRLTPSNASSALAAKSFFMKGFLSTYKQPPFIPSPALQIANADGVIGCYIPDVIPTEAVKYAISGTSWRLSVNGQVVDEVSNLPLATTDNGQTINLKHGPLTTRYVEEAKARIYSFLFVNQDKGSTYSCSVAFQTANGTGPFALVSQTSKITTNGFDVVPEPVASAPAKPALRTIICTKGKFTKTVRSTKPVCPKGYKLKASK